MKTLYISLFLAIITLVPTSVDAQNWNKTDSVILNWFKDFRFGYQMPTQNELGTYITTSFTGDSTFDFNATIMVEESNNKIKDRTMTELYFHQSLGNAGFTNLIAGNVAVGTQVTTFAGTSNGNSSSTVEEKYQVKKAPSQYLLDYYYTYSNEYPTGYTSCRVKIFDLQTGKTVFTAVYNPPLYTRASSSDVINAMISELQLQMLAQ